MVKKLTFILFFSCFQAQAFTLNNSNSAAFSSDEVKLNIASNVSCDNLGMTHDEILSYAVEGVNRFWNKTSTSKLKLIRGGLIDAENPTALRTEPLCQNSSGSCTPNTNMNVSNDILIACNENSSLFSQAGILAVTLPINITSRTINGAIILLNDRSFSSGNVLASLDRSEFASVLAHEIGHAIGLGHSPVKDSLMYFESYSTRDSLGQDDFDGVSFLYPREQPVSCGAIIPVINSDNGPGPGIKKGMLALLLTILLFSFSKKLNQRSNF